MDCRVSIIMGIYNCASTVEQAIDSILAQTYTKWTLIMCDDGSTDDTYSIAERYKKEYPERMILIRNERNRGLNETLNHCLQYVDTEYVARMDGDDISKPNRLEKEIVFLDEHPEYAIVSSPMEYFDENGIFMIGKGRGEPSFDQYCKGTPFCHAPCMVRLEAYRSVDGYAVSGRRLRVEDWDLWVRMAEKGFRGYMLSEPLYQMRDDRNAYKRRKYRYRINEALVSFSAVNKLHLPIWCYIWGMRPLLVGLLPAPVYVWLHSVKGKR